MEAVPGGIDGLGRKITILRSCLWQFEERRSA